MLNRRDLLRSGIVAAGVYMLNPLEALAGNEKRIKLTELEKRTSAASRKRIAESIITKAGTKYLQAGNLELEIVSPHDTPSPKEYLDPLAVGSPLIAIPKDLLDEQISKNFKLGEFAYVPDPSRNDGTGIKMHEHGGKTYNAFIRLDPLLVTELQEFREDIGRPLKINSPYRNVTYNTKCGGGVKSRHKAGQAADIRYLGKANTEEALKALKKSAENQFDDGGVGYYPKQNFVHVDTRGFRARWTS